MLAGQTGGYIVGFLFSALVMWGIERIAGTRLWVQAASMVLGLLVCYAVEPPGFCGGLRTEHRNRGNRHGAGLVCDSFYCAGSGEDSPGCSYDPPAFTHPEEPLMEADKGMKDVRQTGENAREGPVISPSSPSWTLSSVL